MSRGTLASSSLSWSSNVCLLFFLFLLIYFLSESNLLYTFPTFSQYSQHFCLSIYCTLNFLIHDTPWSLYNTQPHPYLEGKRLNQYNAVEKKNIVITSFSLSLIVSFLPKLHVQFSPPHCRRVCWGGPGSRRWMRRRRHSLQLDRTCGFTMSE